METRREEYKPFLLFKMQDRRISNPDFAIEEAKEEMALRGRLYGNDKAKIWQQRGIRGSRMAQRTGLAHPFS
jgi:hypothetical protein